MCDSDSVVDNAPKLDDGDDVKTEDCVTECEQSFKSHAALCEVTDKTLNELLTADNLLSDIPFDISHEEVLAQIAVVKGQSITVYIKRVNLPTLKVIVPQSNATVLELKKSIKRTYENQQRRNKRRELNYFGGHRYSKSSHEYHKKNISWKHIWRTYLLDNESQPLLDDKQLLSNYGVVNKSVLTFILRSKIKRK